MCGRLGYLAEEARALETAGIDSFHVDVMDGHFVPNLTFGPDTVAAIAEVTKAPIHVHMMVTSPNAYVERFAEAGATRYYFHIEAEPYPSRLCEQIRAAGMTPGIALNPVTTVNAAAMPDVPAVLVMAVEPGFAGQRWLPRTRERLESVAAITNPGVSIGVDGNVSRENAVLAKEAGADLYVCGTSCLFGRGSYEDQVRELRTALGER